MKTLSCLLLALITSTAVFADFSLKPLLNKVTLRLHAEAWLTTKTALVNVAINAAIADQSIEKIQADVMDKLNQLVKSDWHIVSFDRQQDKSGLENIQIVAQARLLQSQLTGLRDKAKAISRSGETFTIDNIQFTPSEDEITAANNVLRNNIYQQANNEIAALNKAYPEQKFYMHQIDFVMAPPRPYGMAMAKMYGDAQAQAPMAAPLSVGNKQEIQATVVLGAMPIDLVQKLMTTKP